jgi:hypothetical protein
MAARHVQEFRSAFSVWLEGRKSEVRRQRASENLRRLLARDPPPGAQVPVATDRIDGLKPDLAESASSRGTLLIAIGPCASCISSDLKEWQQVAERRDDLSVVLVSRDTRDRIEAFRESEGCSLPILDDPDGKVSQALNAVWVPRAYLLSPDGRLRWLQKDQNMTPAAVASSLAAPQREEVR